MTEREMSNDCKMARGFPLRRCSWVFDPIMPAGQTRRMVRWLDSVCSKKIALRASDSGNDHRASGGNDGR